MSIKLTSNVNKFNRWSAKLRCVWINFKAMYRRDHKGTWFWEWQVGPIVIMWQHDMDYVIRRGFHIGRLIIWRDTAWKPGREFRVFLRRIKKYIA